jgi:molybdenum cofactor synthesis domain-containing protein
MNELEAVDVAHVDIGDDEIVRTARQKAHRFEAAARLDHFDPSMADRKVGSFDDGAHEGADRQRILDHEQSTHDSGKERTTDGAGQPPIPCNVEPELAMEPPTAAALVIGDEILAGKVEEANIRVLADTLRSLGVLLRRVVIVMDHVATIAHEVRELSRAHDWLFTSGGIGPTHDDVTVQAVAQAFRVPVVPSPEMEAMLRAHYRERCTEGHLRMALVPEGASLETTAEITWPTIRVDNTWLLPGIPEVFRMKLPVVVARLGRGRAFVSHAVYVKMDEGELKPLLDRVVAQFGDVSVGSYPKWLDATYKTKLTFDGRDDARVTAARDSFIALLPRGEPQRTE